MKIYFQKDDLEIQEKSSGSHWKSPLDFSSLRKAPFGGQEKLKTHLRESPLDSKTIWRKVQGGSVLETQ